MHSQAEARSCRLWPGSSISPSAKQSKRPDLFFAVRLGREAQSDGPLDISGPVGCRRFQVHEGVFRIGGRRSDPYLGSDPCSGRRTCTYRPGVSGRRSDPCLGIRPSASSASGNCRRCRLHGNPVAHWPGSQAASWQSVPPRPFQVK
jgi:hypothetical protein